METKKTSLETTSANAASQYVKVDELRAADDKNTCLRPLGLCELGGCCDSCFYNRSQ